MAHNSDQSAQLAISFVSFQASPSANLCGKKNPQTASACLSALVTCPHIPIAPSEHHMPFAFLSALLWLCP